MFLAIWFLPLMSAIVYDWSIQRRVHAAYVVGLVAFAVRILAVPIHTTDAWEALTRAMVRLVA